MMNSKACDQITCGIISVMALIYLAVSRNLLFAAVAAALCSFMWWSVCFRSEIRKNINFAGTAHNTNIYLVVLLGLYVMASSGLTEDCLFAVESLFMNISVIGWIVVMILGRFVIKHFINGGHTKKILGILLNSVFNVVVTGIFFGEVMYQLMFAVTVFTALLSLSRVLQNAESVDVIDTSWVVIVMMFFMLIDTQGAWRLYFWFVLGEYTLPVWWVAIGLLAIAAVNLSVQLISWKRASFGASILLFLIALYYGEIFDKGFHVGIVIVCALFADLTVKYLIGENIIKDKTYEMLIVYAFFIPATLLFSVAAARHNDLIVGVAAVLLLCIFVVINWKLPIDSSVNIFAFGMVFSLLFLGVRYVYANDGQNMVLLFFSAAVFWLFFAVSFGRNRLYKTAAGDISGIMKCVLYLFVAVSLCVSFYMVTRVKNVFYLEKQENAAIIAEGVQPVVKGVIEGNAEEIKSITMEWDGAQTITCSAGEAAEYCVQFPSSSVKITVEMEDGSYYVNQQYFFSAKNGMERAFYE